MGETILFLDSDMIVNQNWITAHLNTLEGTGIIGVVGDSLLPKGQTPNSLDRYLYNPHRGGRRFGEDVRIGFSYFLFNTINLQLSRFFDGCFAINFSGISKSNSDNLGGFSTEPKNILFLPF